MNHLYYGQYNIPVDESEKLRRQLEDLRSRAWMYQEKRKGLKGHEKAAVTRQLTPIEKEREQVAAKMRHGVSPAPMSPEEAFDYLRGRVTDALGACADKMDKFEKYIEEHGYAQFIHWRSGDAVETDVAFRTYSYLAEADNFFDLVARLAGAWHQHLDVLRFVRVDNGSLQSNLVTQYETQKSASMIKEELPQLILNMMRKWDRIVSYAILTEDEQLTAVLTAFEKPDFSRDTSPIIKWVK